jgi:hypothetical protein
MNYVDLCLQPKNNFLLNFKGGMRGLSLSIPGKDDSPLVKQLNIQNYSNLILRTQGHLVEIYDGTPKFGAFGKIYLGKYNGISCLIKVSYDDILNATCLDYKNLFIELNNIMSQNKIIPTIFSYNYISDFDTIQTSNKIYEKNEYIDKINFNSYQCIYIMCMEQYAYDLHDIYMNNLLEKNKVIIETKLMEMFNKLIKLKYFFVDIKLENIVVNLIDKNVSDLKIIDIDPKFCLSYDTLFDMSILEESDINNLIMAIYKQIFYFRSASILFENNESIIEIFNRFSAILKNKKEAVFMLSNLHKLLFMR